MQAHLGKGATVGSVIPTLGAIIRPRSAWTSAAGMIAVRTQWTEDELRATGPLTPLRKAVESAVPLSAGEDNTVVTATAAQRVAALEEKAARACFSPDAYTGTWRLQLGSLGSGNDFIEVTVDEAGAVGLFLHSGSRGIGNTIAQHHISVAAALCKRGPHGRTRRRGGAGQLPSQPHRAGEALREARAGVPQGCDRGRPE